MVFQACRRFDLVNIEGMLFQAWHRWTRQLAATGKHQAIVAQFSGAACFVAVADLAGMLVDALSGAFDEMYANRVKKLIQRCEHAAHIGLVEARTNAQFGLRRQ